MVEEEKRGEREREKRAEMGREKLPGNVQLAEYCQHMNSTHRVRGNPWKLGDVAKFRTFREYVKGRLIAQQSF